MSGFDTPDPAASAAQSYGRRKQRMESLCVEIVAWGIAVGILGVGLTATFTPHPLRSLLLTQKSACIQQEQGARPLRLAIAEAPGGWRRLP